MIEQRLKCEIFKLLEENIKEQILTLEIFSKDRNKALSIKNKYWGGNKY